MGSIDNAMKLTETIYLSANDWILLSLTCQFLKTYITFNARGDEMLFTQPALGKWRQLGGKTRWCPSSAQLSHRSARQTD